MTPPTAAAPAAIAALAALPDVGPARLAALLAHGDPTDVLADLAAGRLAPDAALVAACGRSDPTPLLEAWRAAAAAMDVDALATAHAAACIDILTAADDRWPAAFRDDPDPPAVAFCRGRLDLLAEGRPRVAIVGTRRCSRYGWDVAHRLGRELAAAGVTVVSGLARGIDAAAHRGTLDAVDALGSGAAALPVGIVGTGLDVVYPRDARPLWQQVTTLGLLLSEAPLGTRPARWRFPARNRLIAAVADAVVVVESAAAGGALHTVDEALIRDRPVLAVPGPITSPASVGTNRLLAEVASPVCDTGDVLAAIGVTVPSPGRRANGAGSVVEMSDPVAAAVLDAVGWTVATLDAVAARARRPLGETAAVLAALERDGIVVAAGTGWMRADRDTGVTQ